MFFVPILAQPAAQLVPDRRIDLLGRGSAGLGLPGMVGLVLMPMRETRTHSWGMVIGPKGWADPSPRFRRTAEQRCEAVAV